jgi:hypothetical protein
MVSTLPTIMQITLIWLESLRMGSINILDPSPLGGRIIEEAVVARDAYLRGETVEINFVNKCAVILKYRHRKINTL